VENWPNQTHRGAAYSLFSTASIHTGHKTNNKSVLFVSVSSASRVLVCGDPCTNYLGGGFTGCYGTLKEARLRGEGVFRFKNTTGLVTGVLLISFAACLNTSH